MPEPKEIKLADRIENLKTLKRELKKEQSQYERNYVNGWNDAIEKCISEIKNK